MFIRTLFIFGQGKKIRSLYILEMTPIATDNLNNLKLLTSIIKEDLQGTKGCLERGNFYFGAFNDFANNHKLSGYLYALLNKSCLQHLFPGDFIIGLKSSYLRQWSANERIMKELESLNELLVNSGHEAIFLKGLFLAKRFYGGIDRRHSGDVDILIKKKDIYKIDNLLRKNGYFPLSTIALNKRLNVFFTHEFLYQKKGFFWEVHWVLANHPSFRIDYRKVWEEKQKFILNGKIYYILSPEYELTTQVLAVFMDMVMVSKPFKSLVDVYTILKSRINKDIDWEKFFAKRSEEGLFLISLNVLEMVLGLFNCYPEFAQLSAYISQNRRYLICKELEEKQDLLFNLSLGFRNKVWLGSKNKLWVMKLYQASRIKYFSWASLFFIFRSMLNLRRYWHRVIYKK